MQMAIRALGWATKVLWVILIAIIITIAYSATQINVALNEPTTQVTEKAVMISLPINIRNRGFYDLTQFNVTTWITDEQGHSLADDSSITKTIPSGTDTTAVHTIMLNITKILATQSDLLFNDTTFRTNQYVAFTYANAIPLSIHANQTMPWGAPLNHLTVKQVSFQPHNVTHSIANIAVYFENHNQYVPVAGNLRVEIYVSGHTLIGTEDSIIDTPPNSTYDGQISITIRNIELAHISSAKPSGEVHLFFETATFSYGPVVVAYG